MSKTNEEIIEEFILKFFVKDGEISVEKIVELEHFLLEALQAKDEAHQKEKIELLESIEPCCSTCDMWQFKGEQLTKLKSND